MTILAKWNNKDFHYLPLELIITHGWAPALGSSPASRASSSRGIPPYLLFTCYLDITSMAKIKKINSAEISSEIRLTFKIFVLPENLRINNNRGFDEKNSAENFLDLRLVLIHQRQRINDEKIFASNWIISEI